MENKYVVEASCFNNAEDLLPYEQLSVLLTSESEPSGLDRLKI